MGIGFIGGMEWRRDAAAPVMFRDATIFISLAAVCFCFFIQKDEN
jgi:hypothetical protein